MKMKYKNKKTKEYEELPSENPLMSLFWVFLYPVLITSMVIFFWGCIYSFGINFLFYLLVVISTGGLFPIFHPKLRKLVFQERLGRISSVAISCDIYP